jgi:hypothetical protein
VNATFAPLTTIELRFQPLSALLIDLRDLLRKAGVTRRAVQ